MTDAEIEQIARLYCRKLGLDPDAVQEWEIEIVAHDGIIANLDSDQGRVVGVEHHRGEPQWKAYVETIRQIGIMIETIAEVRATVTEGGAVGIAARPQQNEVRE